MTKRSSKPAEKESRWAGAIGTILFHALVLLFLIFCGIKAAPPEEEEGLTVNYGDADLGSGLFEPAPQSAIEEYLEPEPAPAPAATPPAPEPTPSQNELQTQDIEESLEVKQEREKAEREAEEKRRIEAENRRKEEELRRAEEERIRKEQQKRAEEEAKRKKAMEAGKNAFGSSGKGTDASAKSQGTTGTASGNQGRTDGSANSNAYEGGGTGSGHRYNLNGRSISGRLPEPAYDKNEEGYIVVSIEVDKDGNVISAKAGAAGTTIGDATMRRNAEKAALKAKFNGIKENVVQSGTITYRYKLK